MSLMVFGAEPRARAREKYSPPPQKYTAPAANQLKNMFLHPVQILYSIAAANQTMGNKYMEIDDFRLRYFLPGGVAHSAVLDLLSWPGRVRGLPIAHSAIPRL